MSKVLYSICILMPVHNRLEVTKKGLESLYSALARYDLAGKASVYFELVVVDDGSTDGTSVWIAENYPEIHVQTGDGNLWWSGSINQGARFAIDVLRSEYLLLWNDDVYPDKQFFIELEKTVLKNLNKDIFGSLILIHGTNQKIWSAGGMFNRYLGKLDMLKSMEIDKSGIIQCDWQPGMGTLIHTDIITLNNLWWDEKSFPQYFGDSDFILRAKKTGVKVFTNLNLVAYNNIETTGYKGTKSLKDVRLALKSIKSVYNYKTNVFFVKKHGRTPLAYYGLLKKYFGYFMRYFISQINMIKNHG